MQRQVSNLRLGHKVIAIDLDRQTVTALHMGRPVCFGYKRLISTIPLPCALTACIQTPDRILKDLKLLRHNRVLSACFSVRGPRPEGTGLWRYYADESVCFTRLVYTHQFDPLLAPPDGFGVMAEIIEPAEDAPAPPSETLRRATEDLWRVGGIDRDCSIVDKRLILADPAYVAFTLDGLELLNHAREFFGSVGVSLTGRYGPWSYKSMSQVITEGFACGGAYAQDAGIYVADGQSCSQPLRPGASS
jgi:hypothetical protein